MLLRRPGAIRRSCLEASARSLFFRPTRQILFRAAEAIHWYSQVPQGIDGEHAAVEVKGDDVGEGSAESELFRGLAKSINKCVLPGAAIAHICEYVLKGGVGFFEAGAHG